MEEMDKRDEGRIEALPRSEKMDDEGTEGEGSDSYPERPGESDCIFYLRTGFCGYGNRCRFNHPPDFRMARKALKLVEATFQSAMCAYGPYCKFHHPQPAKLPGAGHFAAPVVYPGGL